MNKHQLIQALKESKNLSEPEATRIVEIFFKVLADALIKGDRVEIRGLCSFYVKAYEPYSGRNPRTGKQIPVKAKRLPFFKAGTELRRRVDGER
jgi:integration host factor subunit beta